MVERLSLFLFNRNPELTMKLRICLLIVGCFIGVDVFAQTSKAIEADLLTSFKKIYYYRDKNDDEGVGNADDLFAKKLKYYTEKYPFTISQSFVLLKNEQLDISTSDDGLFRIYSWDTWSGGTMHFFESVFQYKVGINTISILDTPKTEGDNRPNYIKLYTFKVNTRVYYLANYSTKGSTKDAGDGIQIFDIENGKLNNDVKIIKTVSGLHSKLYYDYDFLSVLDIASDKQPTIYFDATTQTIHVPVVIDKGKVTNRYIIYKFTGQYFEKIK
jgi:uncharacterized membrane protein